MRASANAAPDVRRREAAARKGKRAGRTFFIQLSKAEDAPVSAASGKMSMRAAKAHDAAIKAKVLNFILDDMRKEGLL